MGTKAGVPQERNAVREPGGRQVPADPRLLLTIAGSGGERLSTCHGLEWPRSEGSVAVQGFPWETGRGLGRAGGLPGRDGHPLPPPRAGMMDWSHLPFSITLVPPLLVLPSERWPSGFLRCVNFSFTLFFHVPASLIVLICFI